MVEETSTGMTPKNIGQAVPGASVKSSPDRQAAAAKSAANPKTAKPASRQQRLMIHLLIGAAMTGLVVAGYALLGPAASAAGAAEQRLSILSTHAVINASSYHSLTTPVQMTEMNSSSAASDMAALHAEMDEIARQMDTLKTGSMTAPPVDSPQVSQSNQGQNSYASRSGYDSSGQVQYTLEQMMAVTHEMMAKIDAASSPSNGASAQNSSAGHH